MGAISGCESTIFRASFSFFALFPPAPFYPPPPHLRLHPVWHLHGLQSPPWFLRRWRLVHARQYLREFRRLLGGRGLFHLYITARCGKYACLGKPFYPTKYQPHLAQTRIAEPLSVYYYQATMRPNCIVAAFCNHDRTVIPSLTGDLRQCRVVAHRRAEVPLSPASPRLQREINKETREQGKGQRRRTVGLLLIHSPLPHALLSSSHLPWPKNRSTLSSRTTPRHTSIGPQSAMWTHVCMCPHMCALEGRASRHFVYAIRLAVR